MKGLQAGLPMAALAAVARATSVIGGSQGEDRGSDAALPVDNKFRSEVNDYHSDDHSLDLDAKKTVIEPGHGRRPHHHKARGEGGSNDGFSDGSTYVKPQAHVENHNESAFHEDDHSVQLEKDVVEVVPPHGRGHHHARGQHENVDLIGGPGGVDTGNTFA
ncbi:putative GPI anchored protein, partial [Aspergillus homomorphus CBS 101889]